jgi:hypothetical protein
VLVLGGKGPSAKKTLSEIQDQIISENWKAFFSEWV